MFNQFMLTETETLFEAQPVFRGDLLSGQPVCKGNLFARKLSTGNHTVDDCEIHFALPFRNPTVSDSIPQRKSGHNPFGEEHAGVCLCEGLRGLQPPWKGYVCHLPVARLCGFPYAS